MQKSFWWWQCSDRYHIISLFSHLRTPFPTFSPSLISRTVSVDVKHHFYLPGVTSSVRVWGKVSERDGSECAALAAFLFFFTPAQIETKIVWIKTELSSFLSFYPGRKRFVGTCVLGRCYFHSRIKPVLNWANVCSPNILRTVRRTMIRFLIELLVRRTWFGQFEEFTCSQLACNEMQASARTCGRRAADRMIENVG